MKQHVGQWQHDTNDPTFMNRARRMEPEIAWSRPRGLRGAFQRKSPAKVWEEVPAQMLRPGRSIHLWPLADWV